MESFDKARTLQEKRKEAIRQLTLIPIFTVLMIISGKLMIPLPFLPITFQVTTAILCGLLLGARKALLAQLLYIGMGLLGLPVFTAGGGLAYIFAPSFGYLLGFALAAFLAGRLAQSRSRAHDKGRLPYKELVLISLFAVLVIYGMGVGYLFLLSNVYGDFGGTKNLMIATILYGIWPYLLKDILLALLGAELARRLWPWRSFSL